MKFEWKAQFTKVFSHRAGQKGLSIRQKFFIAYLAYVVMQIPLSIWKSLGHSGIWLALQWLEFLVIIPVLWVIFLKIPGFQIAFGWVMIASAICLPSSLPSSSGFNIFGGIVVLFAAAVGAPILLRDAGLKRFRRFVKYREARKIAASTRGFVPYSS